MHQTKPPCLLTLRELLAPINRAHKKLDDITRAHLDITEFADSTTNKNVHAIANEGIFVLLMSTFEVMLADVLRYYLSEFPDKMDFKDATFDKTQVVSAIFAKELVQGRVEATVRKKMYEEVTSSLDFCLKKLSIDDCAFDPPQTDALIEMKQTRNLLVHADLLVNATYVESAGRLARSRNAGDRLKIDDVYLGDSLVTIKYFIVGLHERLSMKYASYTRLAALRRLWDYMVCRPAITPFDEYWNINEAEDVIRPRRNPDAEARMGGAERLFLALWRDCFNGTGLSYSDIHLTFTGLDRYSVRKLATFLSAAKRFGVIAN